MADGRTTGRCPRPVPVTAEPGGAYPRRRGETLTPIFNVMVTEMPQNAPGSLRDEEYVDVIAYMLSQSRYDDGEQRLQVSDLGAIRIPAKE